MSPEQALGRQLDHRTDLFSLGVVLYEMVTRIQPFKGETSTEVWDEILHKAPVSPIRINPEVPDGLVNTIQRCLEKDPDLRYQSAKDLLSKLRSVRRDTISGESAAHSAFQMAPAQPRRGFKSWAIASAVVLIVALAGVLWWASSGGSSEPTGPMKITPFTSDGGWKASPQFSPDGERVAYSWTGPGSTNNIDIWVKSLGPGSAPFRLTTDPNRDYNPVWSPDGRELAFVRVFEDATAAIYRKPSLGGEERKVADCEGPSISDNWTLYHLDWSSDGRFLVFGERPDETEPAHIVRLSLETSQKETLTTPPKGSWGDRFPTLSPSGDLFVFSRMSSLHANVDLWAQSLSGGGARQLTHVNYQNVGKIAWSADGEEILFAAGQTVGSTQVWKVSSEGGDPVPVSGIGQNTGSVSVWNNRVIFRQTTNHSADIWEALLGQDQEPSFRKLIGSSGEEYNPDYSPDGRKITFSSTREGTMSIYVCNADGSNVRRLIDFEEYSAGPEWSPDGQTIAFDSLHSGNWDIYVVDADGGVPRQLTSDSADEARASWSQDGQWIYFRSNRSGQNQIWKALSQGGEAIQVTRSGADEGKESPDGAYFYFTSSPEDPVLFRMPTGGGEEKEVVKVFGRRAWDLNQGQVIYREPQRGVFWNKFTYWKFDPDTGQKQELFSLEGPLGHANEFSVSPYGDRVLFTENPLDEAELMLVENFR